MTAPRVCALALIAFLMVSFSAFAQPGPGYAEAMRRAMANRGRGGPGFGPPGMGGPPGAAALPGAPTPTPTPPPPPKAKILTGARVTDRVTEQLLDDVYYQEIEEANLVNLDPPVRDDGVWPDLEDGDEIYTNFTESDEYLGPESHALKQRIIRMIESAEELTPLEFYLLPAAATEPFSQLDLYIDKEKERDDLIAEWIMKFLKEYRQDPNDPHSEFWPLYVPRAPIRPSSVVPDNFQPRYLDEIREAAEAAEAEQQQSTRGTGRAGGRGGRGGMGGGGGGGRGGGGGYYR